MIATLLLLTLAAPPERIFVFDFKSEGVDQKAVSLIEAAVVEAADDAGRDAVSSAEMGQLLDVEGAKQAAGCDGEVSCLSEIAGSLGAAKVITGTVTRSGGTSVLSLVLFDGTSAKVLARESVEAPKSSGLRGLAKNATLRLLGEDVEDEDVAPASSPAKVPLLASGGVALGVGVVGAVVGAIPYALAQQAQQAAVDADNAGDTTALGAAHDAYTSNSTSWNTWGAIAVAGGATLAVVGTGLLIGGALVE